VADPRFYDRLGPFSVKEIAALSGAAIFDSATENEPVDDVQPIGSATAGALSYLDGSSTPDDLGGAAVLVLAGMAQAVTDAGGIALVHEAPRTGFARAADALFRQRLCLHDTAIHPDADIHPDARIGPGAVLGAGVTVGAGAIILANVVIGPGCSIGAGTRIGAGASISCADLGEGCNILAGAVIGEAGFGIAVSDQGVTDVPHLGSVEIGNRVTLGGSSCVDRGVFGATSIGDGTKIDNMCHVAHNCRVGRNVLMPAYCGLAGSVVIEDGAMFGGGTGVFEHCRIGKNARLAANSVVSRSVPDGETWSGVPARPIRQYQLEQLAIRRLARASGNKKSKG
jgi:UDP-3-O-[3-hydroxymyristoyl] glucosamine N-acyltransferase